MQITLTLATASLLASVSVVFAAPTPTPAPVTDVTGVIDDGACTSVTTTAVGDDPHELDFRTFGVAGCYDENQGIYTLLQSDAGVCRPFVEPIGSLLVVDNLCTLTIYEDDACSEAPLVVPTEACQNGHWKSYKMTC